MIMRRKPWLAATLAGLLVLMFTAVSVLAAQVAQSNAAAQTATCEVLPSQVRKIVIMGDSIATDYGASSPEKSWPSRLQEYGAPRGWMVEARAIGSTMAEQYLPGGPLFHVTEQVRDWRPDLVLFNWRANEQLQGRTPEQFKAAMLALAGQIKAGGSTTRFLIMNAPLLWYHEFASADKQHTYSAKLREVATELGGHYVDLEPFYPKSGPSASSRRVLFDDIHPNNEGHLRNFTVVSLTLRQIKF